jgi:2-dehydro-3-deoxyphosphogluconate aldolase/(4S)-4-hydroxy-2-oxoglutarate aldolase
VLDPETARACMLARAAFFLTPTLNPATIEIARRYSKVILAGALTPAEVLKTWERGPATPWAGPPASAPCARHSPRST